jgi:hypothetical protein
LASSAARSRSAGIAGSSVRVTRSSTPGTLAGRAEPAQIAHVIDVTGKRLSPV